METLKRSVVIMGLSQRQRVWGMNRQSTEDFQGIEHTLYDSIMMDIYQYIFVKLIKCTIPRMNPKVNSRLQAITTCQLGFINCNKCTTLVRDVDNGEGYASLGQRIVGKSLYYPLNFGMKLILLKKTQNLNFKMLENQIQQYKERIIHRVQVGQFQKYNTSLTSEI